MLSQELTFFLRQPLVWVSVLCYFSCAVLISIGVHTPDMVVEKQLSVKAMTMLMLGLPLFIGTLAPISFLRDMTSNMEELVFTTPRTSLQHLIHRTLILGGMALIVGTFGLIILALQLTQQSGASLLSFTHSLIWNIGVLYIPTIVFFITLGAWLSYRFTSVPVIYAVFTSIWAGYMVIASMSGVSIMAGSYIASESLVLAMQWFDPYGIINVFSQFDDQRSTASLTFQLVFNRAIYVIMSIALLLSTANFMSTLTEKEKSQSTFLSQVIKRIAQKPLTFMGLSRSSNNSNKGRYSTYWTLVCRDTEYLLTNKLNVLILVGWFFLIFGEVASGIRFAEPMSTLAATSFDAWNRVAFDIIPTLGNALLLMWTWQLCWRAKVNNMSELISASPTSSLCLAISHLSAVIIALVAILLVAASAIFAAEMWSDSTIILSHYVNQVALLALPLSVSATLYVAINTATRNKQLAALFCLFCFGMKLSPLLSQFGINHPLLNVAHIPMVKPDLVWEFRASITTFAPYLAYWLTIATAVFIYAVSMSHRSNGTRIQVNQTKKRTLCVSLVLVATTCMHLFLHNEEPLKINQGISEWRAAYEHHYGHWQNQPQPRITDMKVIGNFYPELGNADFALEYILTNKTSSPIEQILVGGIRGFNLSSLELHRPNTVTTDKVLNQHVFTLTEPLAAHASVKLTTQVQFSQPILWPAALHQIVTPEFSYIRSQPLMPIVGFNPDYRLTKPTIRRRMGLPSISPPKPTEFIHRPPEHREIGARNPINVHSIITTNAHHHVIAPGTLIAKNHAHGRATFEFRTQGPIRNIVSWLSLPYGSVTDEVGDTQLHVYAPDEHTFTQQDSIEVNLQAMKDTLHWFNDNIHDYPAARLNLVAIPDLGATGYALPQVLLINHRVGFRAAPAENEGESTGLDQRYRRAVHETAHQWFGHDMGYGIEWDHAFLVESMAKYVELVLIERHRGQHELEALINYEFQRFRYAVVNDTSTPDALINSVKKYDMYSRATLVFTLLRDNLGDDVIISALHRLWEQHGHPNPPASSIDFVRLLKVFSHDAQHELIDLLFLSEDIQFILSHPRFASARSG